MSGTGTDPVVEPSSTCVTWSAPTPWSAWLILIFALVFPTVMAWIEFVGTAGEAAGPNRVTQIAYGIGKAVQFGLPLVCLLVLTRRLPVLAWPDRRGIGLGLGFGLLVATAMLLLYGVFLRDSDVFRESPARVAEKLRVFGLASPAGFALFAGFVTLLHSFLEEYYWRWFVFGWLRQHLPLVGAIALSSLGFAAFHVFPLQAFLPGHFFTAVVPFVLGTAVGGAFWAWLFYRTGSLYGPWLSHLLVDAALFVVGYDLFFVRGS